MGMMATISLQPELSKSLNEFKYVFPNVQKRKKKEKNKSFVAEFGVSLCSSYGASYGVLAVAGSHLGIKP